MQFLAKTFLVHWPLSTHPHAVEIAKHGFPVQCLKFDAIPRNKF